MEGGQSVVKVLIEVDLLPLYVLFIWSYCDKQVATSSAAVLFFKRRII